jgi:hypothetical protein
MRPAREVAMRAPLRTLRRCLVCGFTEIVTDEVVDRGIVLLAECLRCEHRWTERAPAPAPLRVARLRADEELAGVA